MSLFIEFNFDLDDPVQDPPVPAPRMFDEAIFHFEESPPESMLSQLGLTGRFAGEIFGTQSRLHIFSVAICGPKARFIRWDRAGAVVSRNFDYIQSPDILTSFFWRCFHATDLERGHAPTVLKASEDVDSTSAYDVIEKSLVLMGNYWRHSSR